MKAYFQKLNPDAKLPTRGSDFAAGYDLSSVHAGAIHPGQRMLVKTGLRLEMRREDNEKNADMVFVAQVCSRSGLALKHGVFVLNAPGIVDEDYRGEIGVILQNNGDKTFSFGKGDRIAQLVITAAFIPETELVAEEELSETERGEGGFGSTDEKPAEEAA